MLIDTDVVSTIIIIGNVFRNISITLNSFAFTLLIKHSNADGEKFKWKCVFKQKDFENYNLTLNNISVQNLSN